MFRKNQSRSGFTIVETMLSMVFISILLIAVGTVSLQVVRTYHKGITIKAVNAIGYAIGDDIKRSISAGGVSLDGAVPDYFSNSDYGVLCTGEYSYIWNYASSLKKANSKVVRYKDYQSATNLSGDDARIRLIKLLDRNRYYCSIASKYSEINDSIFSPKSASPTNKVIEVIKPSDGDLMIYDFNLARGSRDVQTGQAIYNLTFSVGTSMEATMVANAQCVDNNKTGLYDYCAINKFSVSVLARER